MTKFIIIVAMNLVTFQAAAKNEHFFNKPASDHLKSGSATHHMALPAPSISGATTLSVTTLSITTFSITTFSITTFSITKLSITTFCITTFSITTFSITTLSTSIKNATLSIITLELLCCVVNAEYHLC